MTTPNPLDMALTALQMAVTYGSGISGCNQSYLPPRLLDLLRNAATAIEQKKADEMFAALEAQRPPAGYAIVPIKPTEAMKLAGGHVNSEWLNDSAPIGEARYAMSMQGVWDAMLAAAPAITPAEHDALDQQDAKRYRWLRSRTRGFSDGVGGQEFDLSCVEPVSYIVQGSVAQHLDAAIDAAMSAEGEQT